MLITMKINSENSVGQNETFWGGVLLRDYYSEPFPMGLEDYIECQDWTQIGKCPIHCIITLDPLNTFILKQNALKCCKLKSFIFLIVFSNFRNGEYRYRHSEMYFFPYSGKNFFIFFQVLQLKLGRTRFGITASSAEAVLGFAVLFLFLYFCLCFSIWVGRELIW